MTAFFKNALATNVHPVLCYLIAAYFFVGFSSIAGVPPTRPIDAHSLTYLALSLFMFILPEAKKLKLGQLFEYEARIAQVREEVKEFKEETRQTLSAYTTLVSAVSNAVHQTVNVNLPTRAEAVEAKEELESALTTPDSSATIENEIMNFLAQGGNDPNYALAKMRMELERELRRILGKRTGTSSPDQGMRFLSAGALFREFIQRYPNYGQMRSSFDYVLRVCNAAIHGQLIPDGYAHEAMSMGLRMLQELKNVPSS